MLRYLTSAPGLPRHQVRTHRNATLHAAPLTYLRADGGGGALAFFKAGLKLPGKSRCDWPSPSPPAPLAVELCVSVDVTEGGTAGTWVAVEDVLPGASDREEMQSGSEEHDRGRCRVEARRTRVRQQHLRCNLGRMMQPSDDARPHLLSSMQHNTAALHSHEADAVTTSLPHCSVLCYAMPCHVMQQSC